MRKIYQKPEIVLMLCGVEQPLASSLSLDIYEDCMGGSDALGNQESDYDVWGGMMLLVNLCC